jgi:glutathione peroxidase
LPSKYYSIYDLAVLKNKSLKSLNYLTGKVTLFVNVASYCALTPQYEGLVRIYEKFQPQGFEIVASPCDQFGHQEPGSDDEVCEFAKQRFGARFLLLDKLRVNDGPGDAAPLYKALKDGAPDYSGQRISWNFEKFLVGTDGRVLRRYKPGVQPEDVDGDIQFALEHPGISLPRRKKASLGVQ